ncbi:MAG: methanol dehydrogenase [Pseudopedobacter saltans]|uniref:Methanol dehydrogenase n=1 Tax=Pseudopedobacter saltans TaxID=151895 RepID=A0A2W5F866_9SPHI|nr:MAG: methanol dehydrogenase [Pseudopedobacter saltans]
MTLCLANDLGRAIQKRIFLKKRNYIHKIAFALCAALLLVLQASAQNIPTAPNPPKLVNDFAGIFSSSQKAALEKKLYALDDSTSNQIAIVTIKTLDGYPIEDYAVKLFRSWGIGGKKNDNGVLLLVALQDRKVWIATGYGLEGAIPDITASDIIANQITPYFKTGDYYTGIDKGTDALAAAAAGEYHTPRVRDNNSGDSGTAIVIFIIIVIVIILIIKKGGGGGMMSRRGSGTWFPPIWFGGGGGSSFGGGFGGDSGGGGFGGFGGGSTGGGGAGGSW